MPGTGAVVPAKMLDKDVGTTTLMFSPLFALGGWWAKSSAQEKIDLASVMDMTPTSRAVEDLPANPDPNHMLLLSVSMSVFCRLSANKSTH